eukprot:m.145218 g.145218  ORF g.145218 m.145218 type:complete len:461 (+) comp17218_c0_seq2:256-1638(+)
MAAVMPAVREAALRHVDVAAALSRGNACMLAPLSSLSSLWPSTATSTATTQPRRALHRAPACSSGDTLPSASANDLSNGWFTAAVSTTNTGSGGSGSSSASFSSSAHNRVGQWPGGGSFTAGVQPNQEGFDMAAYNGFLFDMDGVLHRCGDPIRGAKSFLRLLKETNTPFALLTNECRYTSSDLAKQLHEMLGVQLADNELYTAANSARDFFKRLFRHGFRGSTYVVGEQGLLANLQEAYNSPNVTGKVFSGDDPEPDTPVEYVVIGTINEGSFLSTERSAEFIARGARLVYTCPDYFARRPDGWEFGTPKPTVELLERVTGCESYNLGKPNPHMLRMALANLLGPHLTWKQVLFVGDSIGTDIRTSIENGIDCALVLSGTTSEDMLARSPLQPNFVFQDIKELQHAYAEQRAHQADRIRQHYYSASPAGEVESSTTSAQDPGAVHAEHEAEPAKIKAEA